MAAVMLVFSLLPAIGRALRPLHGHACAVSSLVSSTAASRVRGVCALADAQRGAPSAQRAPVDERPTTSLGELPDFRGPSRLMKAAYKESKLIVASPKIPNAKRRAVKLATQTIDAYAQGLSVPLREQLKAFQHVLRNLPPFESALAELTLAAIEREKGGRALRDVIADFDALRRAVVRVGKEASAAASKAETIKEARALTDEGIESVVDIFEEKCGALHALIHTSQSLRKLPRPTHLDPVLVLVGMPNVGKSSIVTATSTGTPEINDYPFTTRRLKMGHVETSDGGRYQVMDTPGVLSRHAARRARCGGRVTAGRGRQEERGGARAVSRRSDRTGVGARASRT